MKRLTAFFVLFLTALCFALTASAAGDAIHSVAIDGNAVKVSVTAQSDCALWGAVYDESGKMTAAQSENVSGAADAQTVTLSFGNIPENACAKAFLLDKETFAPLCAPNDNAPVYNDNVYAILYADGTLVFQRNDTPQPGREVKGSYAVVVAENGTYYDGYQQVAYPPWHDAADSVERVEFADKIQPKSTTGWFENCSNLKEISNLNYLDTSNVIDMSSMFSFCLELTALDVSEFDTANVTNMEYMFSNCKRLAALDVSRFDTSNVTRMYAMFQSCEELTELNVSNFDTANVTDMGFMFSQCRKLTELDVSGFDTSNVTDMWCMFQSCEGLKSLDVSGFDTANVVQMEDMFARCSALVRIYASERFVTNQVVTGNGVFNSCSALIGGRGTKFNGHHTSAKYARIDGGAENPGYFTAKT